MLPFGSVFCSIRRGEERGGEREEKGGEGVLVLVKV